MIWIPILILIILANSWLSSKLKESNIYLYVSLILNTIPLWTFVSYYSKSLLRDAIIYDIIFIICYPLFIGYFSGDLFNLGITKIIGLALVIVGLMLFVG
jgi:hypothetical protein